MADFLLNATTRHQIWLQRLASYEVNTFEPIIKKADRIIRDVLSAQGEFIDSRRALNQVIKQIKLELGGNYDFWIHQLTDDLNDLIESEGDFTAQMLGKATENYKVITPAPEQLLAAAIVRPIQISDKGESVLFEPFLKAFSPQQVNRVNGAIRNGFFQGLTTGQIIKSIRGTRANKFKDGILSTTTRSATIIARTAVNHVANTTKQAVFKANDDILEGWLFVATLDSRTSSICRHYDGTTHEIGKGPIPPLHPACRSTSAPEVKSIFSILKKQQISTRASVGASGGKQTKKSPYYEWLETQPKWFQQDVLGVAQTELFRKGNLTADEFRKTTSNNLGQPLTLPEIKAKNPEAWKDAGLDN